MEPYLLGIMEENAVYKVAFGFDKGNVNLVPNGGKKVVEHHPSIAQKLFIDDPDLEWTEADIKQLGESVKNRIGVYVEIIILYFCLSHHLSQIHPDKQELLLLQ